MGLREEYEARIQQKIQKENHIADEEVYYQNLCRNMPYLNYYPYLDDRQVERSEFGKWATYIYKSTLPMQLSPKMQELINESIDLFPDAVWRCLPENVSEMTFDTVSKYTVRNRIKNSWYAKCKWEDGSIHIADCVLDKIVESEDIIYNQKKGFFNKLFDKKNESNITKEAQERVDTLKKVCIGSQRYVIVGNYAGDLGNEEVYEKLVIFQDGIVFDFGFSHSASFSKEKFAYRYTFLQDIKKLKGFLLGCLEAGEEKVRKGDPVWDDRGHSRIMVYHQTGYEWKHW